ncbi:unnamed protein product [Cuscuta campestris]|uniref:Uncharacterized protein n=1 Tax=Cuscuta campestris TaxID=132261 RepID=A0A484LYZ7_9ASTE|nr:unnamed protein product [Cuscuta campestris]
MWENVLLLVSKQVICFKETCKLYFIPSSGSVTWLFICSIVSTDSAGKFVVFIVIWAFHILLFVDLVVHSAKIVYNRVLPSRNYAAKDINFGNGTRMAMLQGVNELAEAMKGCHVIIERSEENLR